MTQLSKEICARCGVAVTPLGPGIWKHCANIHTKSCGKPPHVVDRAQYDAEMNNAVASVISLRAQ